jgi:hypothetical protein
MMSMVPRSGVLMETPTAAIVSVLMMLSWVYGMDLLMSIATPPPCLSARFLLMMLLDLNLTAKLLFQKVSQISTIEGLDDER